MDASDTLAAVILSQLDDISPVYQAQTSEQLHEILTGLDGQNATIILTADVSLGASPWRQSPVRLVSGQAVVLKAELTAAPDVTQGTSGLLAVGGRVLSFDDHAGALLLGPGSTLGLVGLVFEDQPSIETYLARAAAPGVLYPYEFPLFPALLCDEHCTVATSNVSLEILSRSCSQAALNSLIFQRNFNLVASAQVALVPGEPATFYSTGTGTIQNPFINSSSLQRLPETHHLTWYLGPTVNECIPDSVAPEGGGGGFPTWAIVLISVLGAAALALLAGGAALVAPAAPGRARPRPRRGLPELDMQALPILGAGPSAKQALQLDSASSIEEADAAADGGAAGVPAALTAAVGPLGDAAADALLAQLPTASEDLQLLGPIDVSATYPELRGREEVWRALWRGLPVIVCAVRQVEYARLLAREADLILSISHPNLVSIYLICRAGPAEVAALDAGRLKMGIEDEPADGDARADGRQGSASTDAQTSSPIVLVITEICDRGSLRDYATGRDYAPGRAPGLRQGRNGSILVTYEHALRALVDLASAMDYLHSCGIVHGFLTLGQCYLISAPGTRRGYRVKLTYLGSYPRAMHAAEDGAELVAAGPPSLERDCYDFGAIAWASVQLSNGQDYPPLPTASERADASFAPDTPPALADIMRGCWCPDPARRLRSSQILHALRVALIDTP
ncbi:hypothetical protein QBZ16_002690 [Prototheca wickerhamii]|uniref:Protein kinase domain-containing protein n=1 Tax=Prototheca wickerhamii TaxID=3111 RepID=A0AAD9IKR7_PROWI|nr:hypothetical protein QBZ16_002690 [Prototheca wickerhamii]